MSLAPIRQPMSLEQEFETEAAKCAAAFDAMCRLKTYDAAKARVDAAMARAVERNRGAAAERGWIA